MDKHLNILMITEIPLWTMGARTGGPSLSQTVFGWARAGHTVHLVTPHLSYVSQSDMPKGVILHTFNNTFRGIGLTRRKVGWLFDSASWLTFQRKAGRIGRKLLAKEKFDVVYGYEVWGVVTARKLADRADLPMISRFQGTRMNKWVGARFGNIRFFKYFKAFQTPADLYIMTDDGSHGDRLLAKFNVDPGKVRHWRNGVEMDCPPDADQAKLKAGLGVDPANWMLLALCRLVPEKGVQHAVRAMPQILERFPATTLVVAGDGSYKGALEALAAQLGVDGSVIFTGGLDRDDVAKALAAGDIFISMYNHSNVGNPLLEAMSCGKPVVTLDVGDTNSVVTDEVNGVLLPANRPDRLAEVVCELLADNSRRFALGLHARDWATANLTRWDARMSMEIDEVTKLVGEWHPRG